MWEALYLPRNERVPLKTDEAERLRSLCVIIILLREAPVMKTSSLDRNAILLEVRTANLEKSLLILDKGTSTNDVVQKLANEGAPQGFTVAGEEQSQAREGKQRAWISPRGGIGMTIVLRPLMRSEALSTLQTIGALTVAESFPSILGIKGLVRWPNDVTVNDRKIPGVLIEAKFSGTAILFALLGPGMNANFHTVQLAKKIAEN